MTTAYHTMWTRPERAWAADNGSQEHYHEPGMPVESLITLVHSIHAWRAYHGPVHLVTDSFGAADMERRGLLSLYDEVHLWAEELDDDDIDPRAFMCAGKYTTLQRAPLPFALLDHDLYLRAPVPEADPSAFVFSHWETTDPTVYPGPGRVPTAPGYTFPDIDFDVQAVNTSLAWFRSEAFPRRFAEEALRYARGNGGSAGGDDYFVRAVFTEQHLGAALAVSMGMEMRPVTDRVWASGPGRWRGETHVDKFHHTWLQKGTIRNFPELKPAFCRYLAEDLAVRRPEAAEWLLEYLKDHPTHDGVRTAVEGAWNGDATSLDWRLYV